MVQGEGIPTMVPGYVPPRVYQAIPHPTTLGIPPSRSTPLTVCTLPTCSFVVAGRVPGLSFLINMGYEAHSVLPLSFLLLLIGGCAQSCSASPVNKCERLDSTRRNPGKTPLVEDMCAKWSSVFRPSDR